MAHDGLARSINPVHTMGDGDVLFALATGEIKEEPNVTLIGALAAEVVATAVVEAVLAARSLGGVPSLHDLRISL
jgi:L-aminopeptidase/D-esterase-like protein